MVKKKKNPVSQNKCINILLTLFGSGTGSLCRYYLSPKLLPVLIIFNSYEQKFKMFMNLVSLSIRPLAV